MVIIFAVVGLSALILIHELGHFLSAKFFGVKVEEFGLGFPPRVWSTTVGETVYSVNLLPFGGFVKIYGENDASETSEGAIAIEKERSFFYQTFTKKAIMLLAGITMNALFGWLILSVAFMAGSPEHLMITEVRSNSPAAHVGVRGGDVILEARYLEQVLGDPIKSDAFIGLVKDAGSNPLELRLQRGGEPFVVTVTGRIHPPEGEGSLGIGLNEIGFSAEPFFKSFVSGLSMTWNTLLMVVQSLWNLISKVFVEPEILQSIAGPIGIVGLAANAGSLGAVYVLQFMAIISLNLVVLNLIPFPAFDGGRLFLLVIERVARKPIPFRVQGIVNAIGLAFLIVIMVAVTIQDIGKLMQ